MRFLMKEKWFSLGEDFVIRHENGQPALVIDGKVFSFGDDLRVLDPSGQQVARIRQKLLSWGPTYEIQTDHGVAATIRKEWFTLFGDAYTVDVPGPDDMKVKGNFWDLDYSFSQQGREVARVSKAFFSMTHTYGIDVADDADWVLILCSVVVIDLCNHKDAD